MHPALPRRASWCVFLLLLTVVYTRAEVKLPGVFSDNMVLQRDLPLSIWGWADEGEQVTVEFQGQKASATAFRQLPNPLSRWQIKLGPLKTATTPSSLVVQGKNKVDRKSTRLNSSHRT